MRQESKRRTVLIDAFREGLGLAAIAAIRGPAGIRYQAAASGNESGRLAAGETIAARWWCRRGDDALRVATAATRGLRSRVSPDEPTLAANGAAPPPSDIAEAIAGAAKRQHVAIYSDADILREAENIIRRVEAELESLQRAGEMKSVNRSYRAYRMDASARGEKVRPYANWLNDYSANLVRQLAAALRDA